jgi:hypothetical protein
MKKLILLGVLAISLSLNAAPVPVGMTEAKLIELKGEPESKATMGTKAIYRWPDMQVTLNAGKVERVQIRNPKAEKERMAAEQQRTNVKNQKKASDTAAKKRIPPVNPDGPPTTLEVEVVEVVPGGGVVVDLLEPYSAVTSDRSQRVGGGGGS